MPDITFDAAMKSEFGDEFAGRLAELNHLLIEVERLGDGTARISDLFRATHSLKGLAALAGLEAASSIIHHLESVFERVRSGSMGFSPRVTEAGFSACDHLQRLLEDFTGEGGEETDIAGCLCQLAAAAADQSLHADAALVPSTPGPAAKAAAEERPIQAGHNHEMLRVDPARLDVVLNLSSELMIARARLAEQYRTLSRLTAGLDDHGSAALREALGVIEAMDPTVRTMHRLASSLQGESMRLRMVPVGPLFSRFERVLRDACRTTGHEARLVIAGEHTELDKKLIDQLIDPLTHLVRNAVDHGLETPQERLNAGKSRRGAVRLEAAHESGRIVIRVGDDGRGIDPARIRQAMVDKGLLSAEHAQGLSEAQTIDVIFTSGFSTAAQVTDISGRGVGLDVVRSRIAKLSGTVEVQSTIGGGTTFVISLPLTLAMVRSLLVASGGSFFALPLHAVKEVLRIESAMVRRITDGLPHLEIRRELVPMITLGRPDLAATHAGAWAVLAHAKGRLVAILVDRVLGEEEQVVKPIPPQLRGLHGSSGATILGDGSIALLIDVEPLLASQSSLASPRSALRAPVIA